MTTDKVGDGVQKVATAGRRALGAGLLVAAASALFARTAEALPRGFRSRLSEANRLLRRFGLYVAATRGEHDTVSTVALPRPNTAYDFIVNDRGRGLSGERNIKTSFLNGAAVFEHFDAEESTTIPAVRATVEGRLRTFAHFDAGEGEIDPCWRADVIEGDDDSATLITINERDIDFGVTIGGRTWRVVDGALVETRG